MRQCVKIQKSANAFFQKCCHYFARFWRNICVISTPNASFFGMERVFDSVNFSDVSLIMRNAHWPDARRFCARDAPDFRKFCNFFARIWRKICVTSTPDAHFFALKHTSDSFKRRSEML